MQNQSSHEPDKTPARFVRLVRNKRLTVEAQDIDDFIRTYREEADLMAQWKAAGIRLDPTSSIDEDYNLFYTTDPDVAARFGFDPDTEFGEAHLSARRYY